MKPILTLLFGGILLSHSVHAGETVIGVRTLQIPDGFEVVLAADPSLVGRPIAVARDEKGRMYVTDSGTVERTRHNSKPMTRAPVTFAARR